jgi:hypothetical protein
VSDSCSAGLVEGSQAVRSRRYVLSAYVLGLALGAWVGNHGSGDPPPDALDWVVVTALLIASFIVFAALRASNKPMTRAELEAAIHMYVLEQKRRFPDP